MRGFILKIGDIEGKGVIYDESGDLIYYVYEEKVAEFKTKCKSWAAPYKRGIGKLHLTGIRGIHIKGKIIVTNRRIVFLGDPFHYHAGFFTFGGWWSSLGNYQYAMARSNIAHRKKGKMYIEYPIETIKRIVVGIINSAIYAELDNGRVFKMLFEKEFGIKLLKLIGDKIKKK
jgi:hypothetical protein